MPVQLPKEVRYEDGCWHPQRRLRAELIRITVPDAPDCDWVRTTAEPRRRSGLGREQDPEELRRAYQIQIEPVDVRPEEEYSRKVDARAHEDQSRHEDDDVQQENGSKDPGAVPHENEPEQCARRGERE